MSSINRTATNIEGPLNEFATTGLPQLQQSIQGLEDATRSLEGLIDEVRASRDPVLRQPAQRAA